MFNHSIVFRLLKIHKFEVFCWVLHAMIHEIYLNNGCYFTNDTSQAFQIWKQNSNMITGYLAMYMSFVPLYFGTPGIIWNISSPLFWDCIVWTGCVRCLVFRQLSCGWIFAWWCRQLALREGGRVLVNWMKDLSWASSFELMCGRTSLIVERRFLLWAASYLGLRFCGIARLAIYCPFFSYFHPRSSMRKLTLFLFCQSYHRLRSSSRRGRGCIWVPGWYSLILHS